MYSRPVQTSLTLDLNAIEFHLEWGRAGMSLSLAEQERLGYLL